MFLTKKGMSSKETNVYVSYFEKVADDLLLISIKEEIPHQGILSYWRLTKVSENGIPPLEIGIDCSNGLLTSITFFADTLSIKRGERNNIISDRGRLFVDTDIFTKTNDYVDVDQAYDVSIFEDKVTCAFTKESEFKKSYKNDRLEVFVNCQNQIVGFSICNLTVEEKTMMNWF